MLDGRVFIDLRVIITIATIPVIRECYHIGLLLSRVSLNRQRIHEEPERIPPVREPR